MAAKPNPKTTTAIDVTQDMKRGTGDLNKVMAVARQMMRLQLNIKELTERLKKAEADHFLIRTETLPKIMDSEGCEGLDLANGYRLELNPVFRANLPAEGTIEKADGNEREQLLARREEGISWLNDNGAGDIIKQQVIFDLGKGQEELQTALLEAAKKLAASKKFRGASIISKSKESIHAGTLSRVLREKMESGVSVPQDTFAIFSGREAEIKEPTKGKRK